MTAAQHSRFTLQEYVEVEERFPELKHEYVAGEIVAMAGSSIEHSALASRLLVLLGIHLEGTPCRPHGSDLRLFIQAVNVATYADLSVVCDPIQRLADSPTHVLNPVLVVEVLSPRTAHYDREQKRLYYQQISSLREYVLVAQDRRRVEVWRRHEDAWSLTVYDAGSAVALSSVDYTLSVDELYRSAGVDVP